AALIARRSTGTGQHIEVPLYDSQVAWLANQNMKYLVGGVVPERRGSGHPNIVPYQVFATGDGHLMLSVGNDRQFAHCVEVLGCPELAADGRFSQNSARVANREELVARLDEAFATKTTATWIRALSERKVPCGPISDIGEVFGSDYAKEVGLVRKQSHELDESLPTVANPVRFSGTPVTYAKAPPLLGQHSDEVLQEWLGYSARQIDELRSSGAI
ncbi:MAG: CaiB/BaiF CoA transferase family protein, partial [Woeseiaceae bacterium]